MEYVLRLLFFEVLGIGVIAAAVKSFRLRDRWLKSRNTIEGKLLRSPGESLRQESQSLNDWLMGLLAGIAATPAILLGQMPRTISGSSIAIMAVGIVAWAVPLIYLLGLRRNLELRLRGQRAVAEELNRLMLDGCHVFHDYPAGPDWNIDHIVIAPSGVYAIETKTRRKTDVHGKKAHEVIFNGTQLIFPNGRDAEAPEQARRNAVGLSSELTAAMAEPIDVKALLALPGWVDTRTGEGDVKVNVLNPQDIRQAIITNEKPRLTSSQLQRITSEIEQKCRDVEL